MLRRVVVGFDGSPSAACALEWGADEARLHQVRLVACTVLDGPGQPWSATGGDLDLAVGSSPDSADLIHRLRALVAELTWRDAAEFQVVHGSPARALIAATGEEDLLVVGSRGRTPARALLLGSVSRACLHHAARVVVVQAALDRATPHRRVLVGVDGSPDARAALRVASEEARLRGAALHAVHAVHWEHLGAEWLVPDRKQLLTWGKRLVERELLLADVAARPVVVVGPPGVVLARHSLRAELLVLGARGHGQLAALRLGSTAEHCARQARCPVMVVHAGATPG